MSADHAAEEEEDLDWADDGVHDEAAAVVADHPLLDAPQQLAQRVVGVLLRECLPPEGVTLSSANDSSVFTIMVHGLILKLRVIFANVSLKLYTIRRR